MRALIAASLLLTFATATAEAQVDTLKRIAETGEIRIGFVPDAPPLSFLDGDGNAVGYSIDLCRHITATIRKELDLENIDIVFTPLVSMGDRLNAVEGGDVDIECGATTVTLSRRERVDFTLMTFITGSAVLSSKDNAIDSVDDIAGAKIAVLRGTTTEDVMRNVIEANEFKVELRLLDSHEEGMDLLNRG